MEDTYIHDERLVESMTKDRAANNGNNENRISGKPTDISDDEVKSFFDDRAAEKNDGKSRYRPTFFLYDTDPELAEKRDLYEAEQFLLRLKRAGIGDHSIRILDIGCGVGRWADVYRGKEGCEYVGVDFSEEMIRIAKEEYKGEDNFKFYVGRFQDLSEILKKNGCDGKYDLIVITGVFMYINDSDVPLCISQLIPCVSDGGVIYINNPICLQSRLTLKDFYSKELQSQYSAIYRTKEEWDEINGSNYPSEFKTVECDFTYPEEMRNRSDTADFYWVIKKQA